MGLTFQYISSRISRNTYEAYHRALYDEVYRLNPPLKASADNVMALNPDDLSIRTTEELRFTLYRHWNLYDAMFHSSYVASKIGIWKEKGRKNLNVLLAKMGSVHSAWYCIALSVTRCSRRFSIPQTQQPYAHMDLDLRKNLINKLDPFIGEYSFQELSYPSFLRCYGYRSSPMSAADAVEGISALLDVAEGVKIEIEVEGARNGGEWFGGGKVWEAATAKDRERERKRRKDDERENVPPGGHDATPTIAAAKKPEADADGMDPNFLPNGEVSWWVKNFWRAYDALSE
jgi:cell division control protein 45